MSHGAPNHVGEHPLLFFCPTRFEARALQRLGTIPGDVVVTGPGAAAVAAAVEREARNRGEGGRALLIGVAGGLTPSAPAGRAFVAAPIITAGGAHLEPTISLQGTKAALICTSSVVATSAAKAELAARSGASLVDLESVAFAESAAKARWRWAIIRGVSDGVDHSLPRQSPGWIAPGGATRSAALLWWIVRHPFQLAELIGLGRRANAAMAAAVGVLAANLQANKHAPHVGETPWTRGAPP